MVNTELRRVKNLRLSAPTDSSLRRGRILAEDALRTASLPGAITGRVLVVRSLKLGVIRSHQSSATLALEIERTLYTLGSQAVYAEDPSAGSSHAVYFKNEIEPYTLLALRLARGQSVTDWFWPLAVPFWRPTIARDDALRSLLGAALQTQAGVIAAATLVRELFESRAIEPLLATLRWQEGSALLKACGWGGASLPLLLLETAVSESVRWTRPSWDETLTLWIKRWGAEDARSIWLAAIALVADNPARLQDQRLMLRAAQIIKLMVQGERAKRVAQHNVLPEKKVVPRRETSPLLSGDESRRFNSSQTSTSNASTPANINEHQSDMGQRRAHEVTKHQANTEEASLPDSRSSSLSVETREAVPDSSEEQRIITPSRERLEESPRPSAYAGLFFLIPVLSCLGFSEMLDANPHLIEYHLPERFLSFAGERLGIADDDPVISFLIKAARLREEPAPLRCEFVAPAFWLKNLCRPGPMVVSRTPEKQPVTRLLSDSSKKLTLALWRGRAPQSVHALVCESRLEHSLAPQTEDMQVLLESLLVATRRWLRRSAHIGLRELVSRAGRVALTNTHVDVLFDLRQADVRVRKAGLDLNPGWVAWFGRVVTFYYSDGE